MEIKILETFSTMPAKNFLTQEQVKKLQKELKQSELPM
jgi:hypothetical protein